MRNLKRALSLALSTVMLLGMMVVGTSAKSYPDVDSTMNVEAIEVMQLIGAMKGDDGKFNPNKVISRNEMAAVVSKMLGFQDGIEATSLPYKDFAYNEQWAKPFVSAVYAKGITAGTSATTFGGTYELTTAQAAMWMLKALGYFQNREDIPQGTSWELAAITKADEIGLLKHVKAAANQGITRNEVAQMVLNALQADMVKAVGTKGTNVTTPDGTVVNVGYNITYEPIETYNGEYAGSGFEDNGVLGNDKRLQLAEKLYDGDLTLNKKGLDGMNRPANVWQYKTETVKATKRAEKVYTTEVKVKDIYNDLGRPDDHKFVSKPGTYGTAGYENTLLIDGVEKSKANDNKLLNRNSKDQKVGGNGVVTEVFIDRSAKEIVISCTNLYASEIVKVNDNGEVDRNVKLKHHTDTFETEDFKKGDVVLYTQNKSTTPNAEIKSMMLPAEKKTGTIDKIVTTDKTYYIDGQKYQASEVALIEESMNNFTAVEPKDKVDFYLDANGFIARMDVAEDNINLEDYAFVLGAGKTGGWKGQEQAELIFADGTKKVVDVSNDVDGSNNVLDEDSNVSLNNKIVAFTVKNNEYTLEELTLKDDNKDVKALTAVNAFSNKTPSMGGVALNDKTVFVYRMDHKNNVANSGTDHDWKMTTYTGFANAPSVQKAADGTTVSGVEFSAVMNDKGIAEFVFVQGDKKFFNTSTAEKHWIYVAYDKDVKLTTDKDNVKYYEYAAVVDGKVTTVKMEKDIDAVGLLGDSFEKNSDDVIEFTSMSKNDISYSGSAVKQSMDADKNLEVEVKNGVVTISGADTAAANGTYSYEKDTVVYIVDRDGKNIDVATIDDVTDGENVYKSVSYAVNDDGRIEALVVVYF